MTRLGYFLFLIVSLWATTFNIGVVEADVKDVVADISTFSKPIMRRDVFYMAQIALNNKEKDVAVLAQARRALRFLIANMPESDLGIVKSDTLAAVTLQRIRKRIKRWPMVPLDVFYEFTLPYGSLSEPRDASLTEAFMKKLEAHVDQFVTPTATLSEAATILNQKAYAITDPPIRFVAAPPNKVNAYSAFEVVANKSASCTGESVFLVHALRLAGIPARVAGVPHWNQGKEKCPDGDSSPSCGNHNWVEVYTESGWGFLDQNTANPLNRGWFFPQLTDQLIPGDRFHAVYAATWNLGARIHFPLVFDPKYNEVSAIDRTGWYKSRANVNGDEISFAKA